MKRGFTLIEIVTVMVIVGVLAAMAIPMFIRSLEEAKNREAQAALRLIRATERLYYLEYEAFVSASSTAEINDRLDVDIESENWNFEVLVDNTVSPPTFTAIAHRTLDGRRRDMRISDDSPNVECHEIDCCCYSWPQY